MTEQPSMPWTHLSDAQAAFARGNRAEAWQLLVQCKELSDTAPYAELFNRLTGAAGDVQ